MRKLFKIDLVPWRDTTTLPVNACRGWSLSKSGKCLASDYDSVVKLCQKWEPRTNFLVAAPQHERMLPPPFHQSLHGQVSTAVVLRYRQAARIWAGYFVLLVLAGVYLKSDQPKALAVIALLLSVTCIAEFRLFQRSPRALEERALFWLWVVRDGRVLKELVLWISLAASPGVFQGLVNLSGTSYEQQVMQFGVLTQGLTWREPWRLLPGPLLHLEVWHFLANLVGLSLIGCLGGSLIGLAVCLFVFLLANIGGVCFQLLFYGGHSEAIVGYSAGIFGLTVYLIVVGTWERILPEGLWVSLIASVLIMMIAPALLSTGTGGVAHFAHVGGALAGGLLAAVRLGRRSYAPRNPAHPE